MDLDSCGRQQTKPAVTRACDDLARKVVWDNEILEVGAENDLVRVQDELLLVGEFDEHLNGAGIVFLRDGVERRDRRSAENDEPSSETDINSGPFRDM